MLQFHTVTPISWARYGKAQKSPSILCLPFSCGFIYIVLSIVLHTHSRTARSNGTLNKMRVESVSEANRARVGGSAASCPDPTNLIYLFTEYGANCGRAIKNYEYQLSNVNILSITQEYKPQLWAQARLHYDTPRAFSRPSRTFTRPAYLLGACQ